MDQRVHIAKGIHLYQRARSPHWWADIHVRGHHTRRSTGTSDRQAAVEVALRIAKDLARGADVNHGYSLHHALALWLDEKPRGRTDISIVKHIKGDMAADPPLPALFPNRAAELVDNQAVAAAFAKLSAESANRYMSVIRAALNLACERGHIRAVPKFTKREEKPGRTRWLRRDEIDRLMAALPKHLKAPVEFSLLTGLRRGNVLGLRWDQVEELFSMAIFEANVMKAGKAHAVPLTARALEIVLAQPKVAGCPYVFTYHGKPIGSPKTAWKAAVAKAGLVDVRWHDLRHTWSTYLALSGASLMDLMDAGGWASTEMATRYAHLTKARLAELLEQAGSAMFKERAST